MTTEQIPSADEGHEMWLKALQTPPLQPELRTLN